MGKFADFAPGLIGSIGRLAAQDLAPSLAALVEEYYKELHESELLRLRNAVRGVWKERDLRAKRLAILKIAQDNIYHHIGELEGDSDPSWAFFKDVGSANRLGIPTPI
jgi:hypothetical protein